MKLGQIINPDEVAERDAIHIAIAPVIAMMRLAPGQLIGFEQESTTNVYASTHKAIGIVDPFLSAPVFKGDKFYMFLLPNTITSLRHDWTHPAFEVTPPVLSASEIWLRNYAKEIKVTYEELIENARIFLNTGENWSEGGRFEGVWLDNVDEFWNHFQEVTGINVPINSRESFFSCSC